MLLRSSSTPVLGSLLPSFSESPIHHHSDHHHTTIKHPPTAIHHHSDHHHPLPAIHQNYNHKLSFHQQSAPLNRTTYSCNSSPKSPLIPEISSGGGSSAGSGGFRRAQSEGNLEGLVGTAFLNPDEFNTSNPSKKFSRKPNNPMLETIPSFNLQHARNRHEDEYSDEEEDEEEEVEEEVEIEQSEEIRGPFENPRSTRGNELNLENRIMGFNAYKSLGLEENREYIPEMYLARGLGVGNINIGFDGGEFNEGFGEGGSHGRGGDFIPVAFGRDGGNDPGTEEHYKRLVEENPGNPLFLRNYAEFLYESKGDPAKAEEYYSRAILADPKDGEVLSQYAKLVWELHHDPDRASSYFERAAHASPEDSHVQAAYASFLWETEAEEEDDLAPNDSRAFPSKFLGGAMASATA